MLRVIGCGVACFMITTDELLGRKVRIQDDRDFPLPKGFVEGQRVTVMATTPGSAESRLPMPAAENGS